MIHDIQQSDRIVAAHDCRALGLLGCARAIMVGMGDNGPAVQLAALRRLRGEQYSESEMCGQEFAVPRRDFVDEESARYCWPCQQRETREMAEDWLRTGERWP